MAFKKTSFLPVIHRACVHCTDLSLVWGSLRLAPIMASIIMTQQSSSRITFIIFNTLTTAVLMVSFGATARCMDYAGVLVIRFHCTNNPSLGRAPPYDLAIKNGSMVHA